MQEKIIHINDIQDNGFYKWYFYSDFENNHKINSLLINLSCGLKKELEWFHPELHHHLTFQYHDIIRWIYIRKIYTSLSDQTISSIKNKDIFSSETFHKSHLRRSNVDNKQYIVLIPHEWDKYYSILNNKSTPHITLWTYTGSIPEWKILQIFRTIKDDIFQTMNNKLFFVEPDNEVKVSFREL